MSVTESKAKATVKTSKKTVNPAEAAALKAALEAAQIEIVPLSSLVKSPLNVRTIPYQRAAPEKNVFRKDTGGSGRTG